MVRVDRGVQYVYYMTHKCIMGKLGGRRTKDVN